MLISLENVPSVPLGIQNRLTRFSFPLCHNRYCSSENSCAPAPVPTTTPIWRFSSIDMLCGSRPESASASVDAATHSGTTRPTCLRSCGVIQANSLKSCTSPAICTGWALASKRVIRFTPLFPSRMARQNAGRPMPLGLTTPMPVMTTCGSIQECDVNRAGMVTPNRAIRRKSSQARDGIMEGMPLGIYVSVPFCRTKCSYCNFASDVFSRAIFDRYVERLAADMARATDNATQMGGRFERAVDSVYLGGGTPSLLEPAQLERIFEAVRGNFNVRANAEITVECAPGTLRPEIIEALVRCGVNRISLGVQSFVDEEARSVARLHTRHIVLDDIARLRAAGISNINIDLIAGLPHQTRESWDVSLDQAIATGVAHVSVYMLEVDEDSRLGRELIAGGTKYHAHFVPDEDLTADLYTRACERLDD